MHISGRCSYEVLPNDLDVETLIVKYVRLVMYVVRLNFELLRWGFSGRAQALRALRLAQARRALRLRRRFLALSAVCSRPSPRLPLSPSPFFPLSWGHLSGSLALRCCFLGVGVRHGRIRALLLSRRAAAAPMTAGTKVKMFINSRIGRCPFRTFLDLQSC